MQPVLEHFRELCRPEFCGYPTHSAEKLGMDGAQKSAVNQKMLWRILNVLHAFGALRNDMTAARYGSVHRDQVFEEIVLGGTGVILPIVHSAPRREIQ